MMRHLKILFLSVCVVGLMAVTAQAASIYAIGGATNTNTIVTPATVSREGLALNPISIPGGDLAASSARSVAIAVDTILLIADSVIYTVNGATPLEATDGSYWLVEDDSGGAETFLTATDQVISSKCTVSSNTITCYINADMDAGGDNIVVLVRSNSQSLTLADYANTNVLDLPTWRIASSTTGGAVTVTAVVSRAQTTQMGSATLSTRAAAQVSFATASQDGAIATPNPATLTTTNTQQLGKVTLALSTGTTLPTFRINDGGAATLGSTTLGALGANATFTLTIVGPMSGVKRIFWDQSGAAGANLLDGAAATLEKFTIDATANTATLSLTGATVTDNAIHDLMIQFDGTTTLTPRTYKITGTIAIGSYTASTTNIIGTLAYAGAVVRPAYLYVQNDDWKQFMRFSIDDSATASSATVYARVLVDATKTIVLNLGTLAKGTEKIIWGYEVATAAATAGYTISGRIDVDFIVYGAAPFAAILDDTTKKNLNVLSVQKSLTGDRVVPTHYVAAATFSD